MTTLYESHKLHSTLSEIVLLVLNVVVCVCTLFGLGGPFLTRRLHKQSKGVSSGADYANDMQMMSTHHL